MKNILLLILFVVASCKPAQHINYSLSEVVYMKTINCPDNGECSIELIPNKSLEFKKDDFGNSYPLISDGEKTILKITYQRNKIAKTQDSNYTEIIYAELNKSLAEISVLNNDLQTIKLYFGRLCYCKGETGYYPIKNGSFKLKILNKNSLKIDLEFKINEVPQVISKISETIYFKST
ncbi:MAG: hypothetical protein COC16_00420 [Lutibacter sp.]|nr:MAG: hypothetical protein COC16_00420 [Lutibacter sp.]PHS51285.1 MAG: hypothetical protein COB01_10860 [Lutibacter sp.]